MQSPLFTFVHVTDTHLSATLDVVTPFVASINAEQHHSRPDFIVFGGDNIDGSRDDGTVCEREMPMLQKAMAGLQVPYYMICHNHDTWAEANRGTQFKKYFGETIDYTEDLPGGFALIAVSGCVTDGDTLIEGIIGREKWLEKQLAARKSKKILLFSHMPMFPPRQPVPASGRGMLKDDRWEAYLYGYQPEVSKPVRNIIANHGNVVAHYSGHCHVHSVKESKNTHYITTAALSCQPWEYRYVEVYADKMQHTCYRPHQLDARRHFWTNCFDDNHPDVDIYHNGVPEERDFVIRF